MGGNKSLARHQGLFGNCGWFCISFFPATQETTSTTTSHFCPDFMVHMEAKKGQAL